MKAKTLLGASMMLVVLGLVGGCHHSSYDDYRDYGYGSGSGSGAYREGFRDGRAYERRNSGGRDGRYAERRDGNWWRW